MFQGHFPHESSDEIMATCGDSLPGFLGLNPKPTTADFSACLQDHLNQLACIRSFWCVCVCVCVRALSHVRLFATLCTEAQQAPLSMEFSRQKYWSGLPCPTPENLPDPDVEIVSLVSPASAARFFTISAKWEAPEASEGRVKIQSAGPQA